MWYEGTRQPLVSLVGISAKLQSRVTSHITTGGPVGLDVFDPTSVLYRLVLDPRLCLFTSVSNQAGRNSIFGLIHVIWV